MSRLRTVASALASLLFLALTILDVVEGHWRIVGVWAAAFLAFSIATFRAARPPARADSRPPPPPQGSS